MQKFDLLSEPLIIFLLIGCLLFTMFELAPGNQDGAIEVSQVFIQQLIDDRELVLDRQLSDEEKLAIRNDYIDQEVLVREAMARQLYLNDGGVRHRLADKMFYLLADLPGDPEQVQLDEFYEKHRERYRTPERISFEQRYFSDNESLARNALTQPDLMELAGQAFYMGNLFEEYSADELVAIFGVPFTISLAEPDVGQWAGPYRSGRGWHLVRVLARFPSEYVPRSLLQERILSDWHEAQLVAARRERLDMLRKNYQIIDVSGSVQ